jgi:hypothetical protein
VVVESELETRLLPTPLPFDSKSSFVIICQAFAELEDLATV